MADDETRVAIDIEVATAGALAAFSSVTAGLQSLGAAAETLTEQFKGVNASGVQRSFAAVHEGLNGIGLSIETLRSQAERIGETFTHALESPIQAAQHLTVSFLDSFGEIGETAAIAVVGIASITAAVVTLGITGSNVNTVEDGFRRMAGSVENAEQILAAMRTGVAGTVTDLTLMTDANRLLQAGVHASAADFGALTATARVLAHDGYGTVESNLQALNSAMLTGRPNMLARLGLTINATLAEHTYAVEIGAQGETLTRSQRLIADRNAILDAARAKVASAGEMEKTFKERIDAAITSIENWGEALAQAVARSPNVSHALDAIGTAWTTAFGGNTSSALQTIVRWINNFADAVAKYGPGIIQILGWIKDRIVQVWQVVTDAWSLVPEWFKHIAIEAAATSVAVGLATHGLEAIGGADILGPLSSLATIWSVVGKHVIDAGKELKFIFEYVALGAASGGGFAALGEIILQWGLNLKAITIGPLAAFIQSLATTATGATAVGLAIGGWTVAITSAVAILTAAYQLWSLGTEAQGRAFDQMRQSQIDLVNASRILQAQTGDPTRQVKDFAEAHKILADAVAESGKRHKEATEAIHEHSAAEVDARIAAEAEADRINRYNAALDAEVKLLRGDALAWAARTEAIEAALSLDMSDAASRARYLDAINKQAAAGVALSQTERDLGDAIIAKDTAEKNAAVSSLAAQGLSLARIKTLKDQGLGEAAIADKYGTNAAGLAEYTKRLQAGIETQGLAVKATGELAAANAKMLQQTTELTVAEIRRRAEEEKGNVQRQAAATAAGSAERLKAVAQLAEIEKKATADIMVARFEAQQKEIAAEETLNQKLQDARQSAREKGLSADLAAIDLRQAREIDAMEKVTDVANVGIQTALINDRFRIEKETATLASSRKTADAVLAIDRETQQAEIALSQEGLSRELAINAIREAAEVKQHADHLQRLQEDQQAGETVSPQDIDQAEETLAAVRAKWDELNAAASIKAARDANDEEYALNKQLLDVDIQMREDGLSKTIALNALKLESDLRVTNREIDNLWSLFAQQGEWYAGQEQQLSALESKRAAMIHLSTETERSIRIQSAQETEDTLIGLQEDTLRTKIDLWSDGVERDLAFNRIQEADDERLVRRRIADLELLRAAGHDVTQELTQENQLLAAQQEKYAANARAIVLTADPAYKAIRAFNADMRQDFADSWAQALAGEKSWADAALQPFRDLQTGIQKIMAGFLADLENMLLAPFLNAAKRAITSTVQGLGQSFGSLGGGGAAGGMNVGALASAGLSAFGGGTTSVGTDGQPGSSSPSASAGGGWGRAAAGGAGAAGLLVASMMDTGPQASAGSLVAHGATTGASYGTMILPGWGTAIGAAAGAIAGWIQSGKEWRKVAHDIARDFTDLKGQPLQVTEEFSKMIDQLESDSGLGRVQAITLSMDQLIKQAGGVSLQNIDMFTGKIRDAFSYLQMGQMSVAQATEVMDKNFQALATVGTDSMGRLKDNVKELITLNDQYGTQSKVIAQYLQQQGQSAVAGFVAVVGGAAAAEAGYVDLAKAIADTSAAALATSAQVTTSTGNVSVVTSEMVERAKNAIDSDKGSIDTLRDSYDKLAKKGEASGDQLAAAMAKVDNAVLKLHDDTKTLGDLTGGGGDGVATTTVNYVVKADGKTPAQAIRDLIDSMGEEERAALSTGFAHAVSEGFKGSIEAFLQHQATLYQYAQEGDERFTTWLSGATITAFQAIQDTGEGVLGQIMARMGQDERVALQDGFVGALRDGFKGTIAEFLAQQAALYRTAQEGDTRLKTFLSGVTLSAINATPAAKALVDALAAQQRAAEAAKQELSDLGIQAVATFTAAVASGTPINEVLSAMGPSLTNLRQSYEALGLDVEDVALKNLLMESTILNANPQLINAIAGLSQEMVALDNMGLMNIDTLKSMQRTGETMYIRLQSVVAQTGGTTKDALLPMQNYLHQATLEAELLHTPLDVNTLEMIAQSKELGIWKDTTEATKKPIDNLVAAVQKLVDTLNNIPARVVSEVHTVYTSEGSPDPQGDVTASRGGVVPQYLRQGGEVLPAAPAPRTYHPLGSDTVPAYLTPGEGIVSVGGMLSFDKLSRQITEMITAGPAMIAQMLGAFVGGGSGAGSVNVTLNVEGSVIAESQLMDRLRQNIATTVQMARGLPLTARRR